MGQKQQRQRKRLVNQLAIVEALEPRQLFSISGVDLLGDTTIGRTLTYTVSNGTVSGTVTDRYVQAGVSGLIELDSVSQASTTTGNVLTGSTIFKISSTGEVDEQSDTSIITASNGTQVQNDNDTYFPALMVFPATLTAGTPYTQTVTDSDLDNLHGGGVPNNTQETRTITLQSETPQAVTLSNGKTYQCYLITDTETDTDSAGNPSTPVTTQEYLAKGVGLVKTVQTDSGTTITDELTGDTGGSSNTTTGGQGTLSAAIAEDTIAASELSGADLKGKIALTVTDLGAAGSKAAGNVSVYASTTGSIDGSAVLLGTTKVSAASGKPGKATITPKNVSLAAGTYTLIVRATDASGANTDTATGSTLNVTAATANFSTTKVTDSPRFATIGKPVTVNVSLVNTGNAPTTGTTTVSVVLTANGSTALTPTLSTVTVKAGIKTNKATKAALKFVLPADAFNNVVDVSPLITITENGVTTTLVGPEFQFKAR